MTIENPERLLLDMFRAAVERASAQRCLPGHIPSLPGRKAHIFGAGKAAAAMAKVIERQLPGQTSGIVVTRYGHALDCESIEVVEAAHPVPDEAGLLAAGKIVDSAHAMTEEDYAICLISGGASALLTLPDRRVNLAEKQSVTRQLLLAGAEIRELNCVRKHLSAIKGGRLMQQIYPATALTLCISDVAGDDPSVVGSGPTVGDPTTCNDVLNVLARYNIDVADSIRNLLRRGALETPEPDHPVFQNSNFEFVAKPADAIQSAAAFARNARIEPVILDDSLEGDTNVATKVHVTAVRRRLKENADGSPFVLLSGGETTVTVTGSGKGGPNTQFALALAIELNESDGIYAIACDTDGMDGTQDNAGAVINPATLRRAREKNVNPENFLKNNNSYEFFNSIGDLVITGPTLTNVNDFRAIYCDPDKISRPL